MRTEQHNNGHRLSDPLQRQPGHAGDEQERDEKRSLAQASNAQRVYHIHQHIVAAQYAVVAECRIRNDVVAFLYIWRMIIRLYGSRAANANAILYLLEKVSTAVAGAVVGWPSMHCALQHLAHRLTGRTTTAIGCIAACNPILNLRIPHADAGGHKEHAEHETATDEEVQSQRPLEQRHRLAPELR